MYGSSALMAPQATKDCRTITNIKWPWDNNLYVIKYNKSISKLTQHEGHARSVLLLLCSDTVYSKSSLRAVT